ncbi:MAG: serine hydrolase [Kiritimatiellae bacterium]|nr:serine hydrolase [Kiritimatiellia bacterium]
MSDEEATDLAPEAAGMDAGKLAAAVRYLEEHSGPDGAKELLIVRHDRAVWRGPRVEKVHGIWSCTKSFTSTVLGLLIDDGRCGLDTPAGQYVPELDAHYPGVTLRHFATMTSGYRAIGDEPQGTYVHGPSKTPFVPAPEPLFAPGTLYAYWDSAMNQFAHVLTRIAGEPIAALFKRRIADPIGMNPHRWSWGDFGPVDGLLVNGGSGNNGKHVQIAAAEMARFGRLFLNRGSWAGRPLLSPAWVAAATTVQVPASTPLGGPLEHGIAGSPFPIDGRGVYGFNWWLNGVAAAGARRWPDVPADAYAASGYNNNDMFVIPEWNMVVVRLGLDQKECPITDATYNTFLGKIGAALTDA